MKKVKTINFDSQVIELVTCMKKQSEYFFKKTGLGSISSDVEDIYEEVASHIDLIVKSKNYKLSLEVNDDFSLTASPECDSVTIISNEYVQLAEQDIRYYNALKNVLSEQLSKGLLLPKPFCTWVANFLKGEIIKPKGNAKNLTVSNLSYEEKRKPKLMPSIGRFEEILTPTRKNPSRRKKYSSRNLVFTQMLYVLREDLDIKAAINAEDRLDSLKYQCGYDYIAKVFEIKPTTVRDNNHLRELHKIESKIELKIRYPFLEMWSFYASDLELFTRVSNSQDKVIGLPMKG